MNLRRLAPFLAACVACGRSTETVGYISAIVQSQTASTQLTRVSVTLSPGGASRDLTRDPADATGNTYVGILTVPTGTYSVRADAFAVGTTPVATGSANVTILKGQTAQVLLTLLDRTGPAPMPDHSPVVTSLVAPAAAQVDDVAALTASAMDADPDPMTFSWTASPSGCATFSAPASLATNFTAKTVGTCTVTFTVTANARSDSKSANIEIAVATGSVSIVATYVPQPLIKGLAFSSGATAVASVSRDSADATLRVPFHRGTLYTVLISIEPAPEGAISLDDSCQGTIGQPTFVSNASSATGTWTPTVSSGACILTAHLTRQTLTDAFPVVVLPAP